MKSKRNAIVERIEGIAELLQTQTALRQRTLELQTHNEELEAFAHTVAHNLKNPLSHIIGFAEMLDEPDGPLSDQDRHRYARAILRSGHKMNNIIDELLLLAEIRGRQIQLKPLDMACIVAEAQGRLAPMIEEHQAEIHAPSLWPVALGYDAWVEEVWFNYLSNAIKYGGQPPRVTLGATLQINGQVCFWVSDNGPGLTPKEQTRVFRPFERLNPTRAQGHGLGLSIVQRIVERLGGQVGVESIVGRGSVFSFTLPGDPMRFGFGTNGKA